MKEKKNKEQYNIHVKVGDRIKILAGDKKGLIGNVNSINRKTSQVTIDSIPFRIKSIKSPEGQDSKKKELPVFIHSSNVMLWDKEKNIASKVGVKIVNNEKKRYFKKSGNII